MDDGVQLISTSKRRNGRSSASFRGAEQQYLSDTEISYDNRSSGNAFEETTVFSDTAFGDSLPSMRAQLAATQMLSRSRRNQSSQQGESSRPLLAENHKNETNKVEYQSTAMDSSLKERDEQVENGDYISGGGGGGVVKLRKVERKERLIRNYTIIKVAVLTLFMVMCVILFAVNGESEDEYRFINIGGGEKTDLRGFDFNKEKTTTWKFVTVTIEGPFIDITYHNKSGLDCENYIFVCGIAGNYTIDPEDCPEEEDTNCHSLQLAEGYNGSHPHSVYTVITKTLKMDYTPTTSDSGTELTDNTNDNESVYSVQFMTMNQQLVEFQAAIVGEKLDAPYQVGIAAVILVGVYVLIGFEIVHRTMAAWIGSTCTLAVLSMIEKRPTLDVVVEWIDLDTICLLFGMMTLVAIFSQTGFFDYSAVKAYKLARGKIWPLITLLCLFSAVVSAFLDNVTTVLLLTPVSIRLCQVLNLDPRPILIAEVVFSNIGGTATAVGDPPNVIIISNTLIKSAGINFPEFTLHLFLGIIMVMVTAYGLLSLIYYVSFIRVKNKDPPHIAELQREIDIWERTAERLNVVSLEERAVRDAILAKAADVRKQLNQQSSSKMDSSKDMWQNNLAILESKYKITNWVLLIKSVSVLAVVIILFFISNLIPNIELELGWIAIFGAVVLIILADIQNLETVLHKIEWGTLLFFAGLFVLMEGLGELGLISFIGDMMIYVIQGVEKKHQMFVAITLILWVSAIASSFIDNIPFTTATIPVVWELAQSPELCLSLRPLVWALAMGACLGGNGTLIGASANVVCAGIAEQNGYKISFVRFLLMGFPMMLVTTFTAMIYLWICHIAFDWDISCETKNCVDPSVICG